MTAPSTTAVTCPKCGRARTAGDLAPAWQCPGCGIAYRKFQARLEQAKARLAPDRNTALHTIHDSSIWSLVSANAIALVTAFLLGWQLTDLMLVYWIQSVIIGASYFARIRGLDRFSTENFLINNKQVAPTAATKRQTANFFLLHYGGFHAFYLFFIVMGFQGGFRLDLGLAICAIAFGINHFFSYRCHREQDAQGTPNIGTLMFTPYLRIAPMHLTIIFGATVQSTFGLLFFGALKMVADVAMHYVEHRVLAKKRETDVSST